MAALSAGGQSDQLALTLTVLRAWLNQEASFAMCSCGIPGAPARDEHARRPSC